MKNDDGTDVSRFDPQEFDSEQRFTRIGSGSIGGKATGLSTIREEILPRFDPAAFPGVTVDMPRHVMIATDVFAAFMDRNRLWEIVESDYPDSHIAKAFQEGELPVGIADDLRALIAATQSPLALRPSSALEDLLDHSFAGIYTTKMIPNHEPSDEARLRRLVAALKLVWASTFFSDPVISRRAAGLPADTERMAVTVQEVVGDHHGTRFYPTVSAVARSYNHYPAPGNEPEDGVVSLALGLGKTIIDGGHTWSYCWRRPTAPPPFKSTQELLKYTQNSFWAINVGEPPPADPLRETECLVRAALGDAENDGALKFLGSTYDAESDSLRSGLDGRGPRALTFAPLLQSRIIPFTEVTQRLLELSREATGGEAEIEIAANLDPVGGLPMRVGFVQIRPMMGAGEQFHVGENDLEGEKVLVASDSCLGHGVRADLEDIIYIRPQNFDRGLTRTMAAELDAVNRGLVEEGRQGVFIGLGRWGTTDDRFGVPVTWAQISAARVIVEATLPGAPTDLSHGTHFFHRLLSYKVLYLSVQHDGPGKVDWEWLDSQPAAWESRHVRQVRLDSPLEVRIDGATRRGVLRRGDAL
jgi:hypothetical protein